MAVPDPKKCNFYVLAQLSFISTGRGHLQPMSMFSNKSSNSKPAWWSAGGATQYFLLLEVSLQTSARTDADGQGVASAVSRV